MISYLCFVCESGEKHCPQIRYIALTAMGRQWPLTIVAAQRPLLRVKRSLGDEFSETQN